MSNTAYYLHQNAVEEASIIISAPWEQIDHEERYWHLRNDEYVVGGIETLFDTEGMFNQYNSFTVEGYYKILPWYEKYRRQMEKSGRQARDIGTFGFILSKYSDSITVVRNSDSAILCKEMDGVLIPTHFLPASGKSGLCLVKAVSSEKKMIWAVTSDIAKMLVKVGYTRLANRLFRPLMNQLVEKEVLVNGISAWRLAKLAISGHHQVSI